MDNPNSTFVSNKTIPEADEISKKMPVAATGVWAGAVIQGIEKATEGSNLEIQPIVNRDMPFQFLVRPNSKFLDKLEESQRDREIFLSKMKAQPVFQDKSMSEIWELLKKEAVVPNTRGLADHYVMIQGTLDGASVLDIPESVYTRLAGEYISTKEVKLTVEAHVGRESLIFSFSRWGLVVREPRVKSPDKISEARAGVYFLSNPAMGVMSADEAMEISFQDPSSLFVQILDGFWVCMDPASTNGVTDTQRGQWWKEVAVDPLVQTGLTHDQVHVMQKRFDKACSNFTLAVYKSMIQKLIRTAATELVFIDGTTSIPAHVAIRLCIAKMVIHPGTFVPDLQKFVRGSESIFKRLAVIAVEDSWMPEEEHYWLLHVLVLALISRLHKRWVPSPEIVNGVIEWTTSRLSRPGPRCFKHPSKMEPVEVSIFKRGRDEPRHRVMDISLSNAGNASRLLDHLGAFSTDYDLLRALARGVIRPLESAVNSEWKYAMPIEHIVDQHVWPDVALLIPPSIVERESHESSARAPFGKLMRSIFTLVTGINPRHGKFVDLEHPTIASIRKAQRRMLGVKQFRVDEVYVPKLQEETPVFEFPIHLSWYAALVGSSGAAGATSSPVSLDPRDPTRILGLVDKHGKPAGVAQMRKARQFAQAIVERGVPLNRSPFSVHSGTMLVAEDVQGKDCDLRLTNLQLKFQMNHEYKCLDEVIETKKMRVGILPDVWSSYEYHHADTFDNSKDMMDILLFTSMGDQVDYYSLDKIMSAFRRLPYAVQARAILLLRGRGFDGTEIPALARDGSSTASMVSAHDAHVLRFFLWISMLAPAALRRVRGTIRKFSIAYPPLLWDLVERMQQVLVQPPPIPRGPSQIPLFSYGTTDMHAEAVALGPDWIQESDHGLVLKEGQQKIMDMIKHDHRDGKRAHFAWMATGSGKTLVSLKYVLMLQSDLQRTEQSLENVMFVTDRSALEAVVTLYEQYLSRDTPIWVVQVTKKEYKNDGKRFANAKRARIWARPECPLPKHSIVFMHHDAMRVIAPISYKLASKSVVIIDEIHKMMRDSQRSAVALQVADLAPWAMFMSATPVVSRSNDYLMAWLRHINHFTVNKSTFWVASNALLSSNASSGNTAQHIVTHVPLDRASFTSLDAYLRLLPVSLGGRNPDAGPADFAALARMCYVAAERAMVARAISLIQRGDKVFVLARNKERAVDVAEQIAVADVGPVRVLVEGSSLGCRNLDYGSSIQLTPERVREGQEKDYVAVVAPLSHVTGYSLSTLDVMLTSVYPSSQATRTQSEGRINRLGATPRHLIYEKIVVGILRQILDNHEYAKNLESALMSLATKI